MALYLSFFNKIIVSLLLFFSCINITVSETQDDISFDFVIENNRLKVNKEVVRVKEGDRLRFNWTSNKAVDIHLHGYDIEQHVEPNKSTSINFKAYASGRYPVNIHSSGDHSGSHHGGNTLFYLEVMPR